MADVRTFRALRPPRDLAARVASPPYDVVDTDEARRLADGNPVSFLRVSRPEIDLDPGTDPHADGVHHHGRDRLDAFIRDGVLRAEAEPAYYVYRQTWQGRAQTGVVACVSVADYLAGVIRTHEHTRPDKEGDRARHIEILDAHDEPVFLLAPENPGIATQVAAVAAGPPEYDFTTGDGVRHTFWVVTAPERVQALRTGFAAVPRLYVADGHHRSAAAAAVHHRRETRGPDPADGAQTGVFPAVVFPAEQLRILAYNRVVTDLAGHRAEDLPGVLAADFEVEAAPAAVEPEYRHVFGMYLAGQWYRVRIRPEDVDETDPVARLDVALLQNRLLGPVLRIGDPRTDDRIRFVGGIRGTAELERLVDSGDAAVAFSLHPTSAAELLAVADAGQVMPPKSTWFEPKLRSGLFVHAIGARPGD